MGSQWWGRPSTTELRYGKVPRHVARAFLRSFDYNQMYSAPADTREGGKTATTGYNDSWFLDPDRSGEADAQDRPL